MKILIYCAVVCLSWQLSVSKTPRRDLPNPFRNEYRYNNYNKNFNTPTTAAPRDFYKSVTPIAKPKTTKSIPPIQILSEFRDAPVFGNYQFGFETQNGIRAEETGLLKKLEPDVTGQNAEGYFSYVNPDGKLISLTYTADENGFVAKGDHLPTPPPIPEAILKALEWNAAHPEEWDEQKQQEIVERRNKHKKYYKNNNNIFGRKY